MQGSSTWCCGATRCANWCCPRRCRSPIDATFDLRDAGAWILIRDAMTRLIDPENEVIRVIGAPVREAGLLIEVTMETAPLRAAMIDYGLRILVLSAVISIVTARAAVSGGAASFWSSPSSGVVGAYAELCRGPRGRAPHHHSRRPA